MRAELMGLREQCRKLEDSVATERQSAQQYSEQHGALIAEVEALREQVWVSLGGSFTVLVSR